MKKILLALTVASLMASYSCDDDPNHYYSEHCIRSYLLFTDVTAEKLNGYENAICIRNINLKSFSENSVSDEDRKAFKKYAEHFGDTHYNREDNGEGVFAHEFTAVNVMSDTDFDAAHPAGSSLGDVIIFRADTLWPYINSGYKDTFKGPFPADFYVDGKLIAPWDLPSKYHPVAKRLTELTADDMKLLKHIFLNFIVIPEEKEHTLTITFYEGEKEYSTTLDFVFGTED